MFPSQGRDAPDTCQFPAARERVIAGISATKLGNFADETGPPLGAVNSLLRSENQC